ncbi:MAG: zinc ribbon domain-containing protein [Thermoguttaceae bacterium]|jgi:putative FmdB family regulatory protein
MAMPVSRKMDQTPIWQFSWSGSWATFPAAHFILKWVCKSLREMRLMPIYEYVCDDCHIEFEALIRGAEKPACPSCGGEHLTKSMSVPAAHTASGRESTCPAREVCAKPGCAGDGCRMAQWME